MRTDIAKCTTERPRTGATNATKVKYGGKVLIDSDPEAEYSDEHGGFRSSARGRHPRNKDLSDALGALRGNLRANVGRPWNKVFSEFCSTLDRRSVAGYHIWTHLMWAVEINTWMEPSGKIFYMSNGAGAHEVSGYYVHPKTGLLCHAPRESLRTLLRQRKRAVAELAIPVPDAAGWYFRRIDGLWFRTFERVEEITRSYYSGRTYKEKVVVERKKRSASKREIRWIESEIAKMKNVYREKL